MIRNSPRGLKSPYSRIIFGLSIGDIIKSSALFSSVFAAPKDTPDSAFAIGTTESCDAIGCIQLLGILLTIFYLLFLIYYFFRRINGQVLPQNFARREEKYVHILIWFIALAFPFIVLVKKAFNPVIYGATCSITSRPFGCGGKPGEEDYIECTRGQSAPKLSKIYAAMLGMSFLILLGLLTAITCHVYSIERTLSNSSDMGKVKSESHNETPSQENADNNLSNEEFCDEESKREKVKISKDNQKNNSLTKKSFKQALFYVLTFITTFGAPIIGYGIIGLSNTNAVVAIWILSVFFSPYGIFLILIYTKPKVDKLSEMFPGSSWHSRFSVVLFAGGEVPPAQELREPPHFMAKREEQNEEALTCRVRNGKI
ncbi:hypothetical protein CTEN210_06403 [Chaetoceros tenuissimus]|uniref:G-protein coupled receptors family 1 profile domain-containing protein n=1 Tax=Chaetoceros tenuissimus TaxID=426638 RepID=A0AAD3CPY7_9STRA|nr:hypothetical protein CTEN210_06403 [Chaetoceros tenuissimus]